MAAKKNQTRTERDSLGEIDVPAGRYWGAVTQRALENFPIGEERMPLAVIYALAMVKKAAAQANADLGSLDKTIADAIGKAADKIIGGHADDHFPLPVWQTGSGTQSNMNVNEVIANMASVELGGEMGQRDPVHPNDHVNRSQSSNDVFPTAMQIAAALDTRDRLIPAIEASQKLFEEKSAEYADTVKIGRTHMQDAVPMTFGQELSGYAAQLSAVAGQLHELLPRLCAVPIGGTAIGTGLNSVKDFDRRAAAALADRTGLPITVSDNKFAGIAAHDVLLALSGVHNTLAAVLMKIGNDIRLLCSGPRAGLAEVIIPANEPGSSIMPGKVNPTQVEALTQVCAEVMGNHVSVGIAASSGQLELNVFKPVIIYDVLQSSRLLADAMHSFAERCLAGLKADAGRMRYLLENSLMTVTALAPEIGYDNAAKLAHYAYEKDLSLRDAALELGILSAEDFDRIVKPEKMIGPQDDS